MACHKPPTAHSGARPSCYDLERRVTSLIACEPGSRGRDALLRDPALHVSTLFRFRNLTEANSYPSTDRSWPRYKNLSLGSLANRYHDAALRPKSQLREALLRLPLTNREAVRGSAWPKHLRPCVPFPHGLPRPLPPSSREAEYEAGHPARFPMRLSVRLFSCRSRTPPDVPAAKKSRRRRSSHVGAGRRSGKERPENFRFE